MLYLEGASTVPCPTPTPYPTPASYLNQDLSERKKQSQSASTDYFEFFFTFVLEEYASLETGPILSHMRLEKNKCENKRAI